MSKTIVIAGASDEESLEVTLTSVVGGLDLTTLTSVSLEYTRANGQAGTWTTTLSAGSATSRVCTHQWASDGSDVPSIEVIRVRPRGVVGGNIYRFRAFQLDVKKDG